MAFGAVSRGLIVWVADLTSVVVIVMCNKTLMSPPVRFTYPVTLTAAHFACTAVAAYFVRRLSSSSGMNSLHEAHAPEPAATPASTTIASFVLASSAAIITVNASLMLNSVAFYQVMKMFTLPFVAIIEATVGERRYGWAQTSAFVAILVGVGLTIKGDIDSSLVGFCMASASVVFAGMSQLLCGHIQTRYELSPSTLLSIISPYKACLLFVVGPFMDWAFFSKKWITEFTWTPLARNLFLLSCFLAIAVNFAQYSAIRLLGPGIYSALGQVKTAVLVVVGSLAFHRDLSVQQMLGTGVAVLATGAVAWLEQNRCAKEVGSLGTR